MFGADATASFANYFQKGKIQFSQCTVQLIYTTFDKLFILVFVTNYPISWQFLMDTTFDYPLSVRINFLKLYQTIHNFLISL